MHIVTFNTPNLLPKLKIGCLMVSMEKYILTPLWCYNCSDIMKVVAQGTQYASSVGRILLSMQKIPVKNWVVQNAEEDRL